MDSDNFLVVSSNSIDNKNIEEYLGIVVGSTVRARNVGSDFFASLKNLVLSLIHISEPTRPY